MNQIDLLQQVLRGQLDYTVNRKVLKLQGSISNVHEGSISGRHFIHRHDVKLYQYLVLQKVIFIRYGCTPWLRCVKAMSHKHNDVSNPR